jgi:uncharacterized protein involved in type VI secretion and phage assembly
MSTPLFGKYRGIVTDNVDPEGRCRVRVAVPSLDEAFQSNWAEPCVPLAGHNSAVVAIPSIGAAIWIEFEQGDRRFPIWVGGFWTGVDQPPELGGIAPGGSAILLQSADGTRLSISDLVGGTGGISIRASSGAEIVIDAGGIRLANGKGATIELAGSTTTANGGALEVI